MSFQAIIGKLNVTKARLKNVSERLPLVYDKGKSEGYSEGYASGKNYGYNRGKIDADNEAEVILDNIITEQENIIAIQNTLIGGESV